VVLSGWARRVAAAPPRPAPPIAGPVAPAQASPGSFAGTAVSTSPFHATKVRTIHFATNRGHRARPGTPSGRFGDQLGDGVSYGSCPVNVPTERREPGKLPMPKRGAAGDPVREFFILGDAVRILDEDGFRDLARGADGGRDVLVYVHGFNTSFDFAVVRMAQVVEDLDFAGMPVVFSWPARAVAVPFAGDYSRDEANADRSYGALARVFRTLVEEQEARPADRRGKIHVVAHSLGNRVTMRALSILDTLLPTGAKPMGQIVLAAPDVSVEEFARLQPSIERRSERVSLYFNPNDRALWASFAKHGRERRAGNSAQFLRGLDNIDAARADTSLLGHGYWSDARAVLLDMRLLITKGWEPARRVPDVLRAFTRPQPYWAFPAERRFGPIPSPW
jgi:esterase/lipase superfamily enzyme